METFLLLVLIANWPYNFTLHSRTKTHSLNRPQPQVGNSVIMCELENGDGGLAGAA